MYLAVNPKLKLLLSAEWFSILTLVHSSKNPTVTCGHLLYFYMLGYIIQQLDFGQWLSNYLFLFNNFSTSKISLPYMVPPPYFIPTTPLVK